MISKIARKDFLHRTVKYECIYCSELKVYDGMIG